MFAVIQAKGQEIQEIWNRPDFDSAVQTAVDLAKQESYIEDTFDEEYAIRQDLHSRSYYEEGDVRVTVKFINQ